MPAFLSFCRTRKGVVALVAALAWCVVVGRGIHSLMLYAYTPARVVAGEADWPASLQTSGPETRPLLVMFVHPHCACSRASVAELAVLMASARGRLEARVYVQPIAGEDATEPADLPRAAARIPGVEVVVDVNGAMSRALNASVSGETFLYNVGGRRVFRGGLTAARGHEGDNDGRRAVLSLLDNASGPERVTPVFGCYLRESGS